MNATLATTTPQPGSQQQVGARPADAQESSGLSPSAGSEIVAGQKYNLFHSRFGRAVVKVLCAQDTEWIEVLVIKGRLRGMLDDWTKGDVKTLRREHCTFSPNAEVSRPAPKTKTPIANPNACAGLAALTGSETWTCRMCNGHGGHAEGCPGESAYVQLTADLDDAIAEYPKVPQEVWIGTDSPVDKVRWLARRCNGSDQTISRLHRENEELRKLISELSQLVWEHHSSTIMRPNVCPACSDEKWAKVLDMARSAKSPNDKLTNPAAE